MTSGQRVVDYRCKCLQQQLSYIPFHCFEHPYYTFHSNFKNLFFTNSRELFIGRGSYAETFYPFKSNQYLIGLTYRSSIKYYRRSIYTTIKSHESDYWNNKSYWLLSMADLITRLSIAYQYQIVICLNASIITNYSNSDRMLYYDIDKAKTIEQLILGFCFDLSIQEQYQKLFMSKV